MGQSRVADKTKGPMRTSVGVAVQGDQIAALTEGAAPSAGKSIRRKPVAIAEFVEKTEKNNIKKAKIEKRIKISLKMNLRIAKIRLTPA